MNNEGDNKFLSPEMVAPFMETMKLEVSVDKFAPFLNHWLHYFLPFFPPISSVYHSLK
jgi:hypothetical protein